VNPDNRNIAAASITKRIVTAAPVAIAAANIYYLAAQLKK
jgi:hypothetical protein